MLIGIYGASGFGREVMPLAKRQFGSEAEYCFIDDQGDSETRTAEPVLTWDAFREREGEKQVALAIADAGVRKKLATRLRESGISAVSLFDPGVLSGSDNEIGEGAIFCGFSQITSNAKIGRFFHANIYSYVAHDCVIGDFVTFAPRVCCNGNVSIGDFAYIGTGAIIRQGIAIGEGAVIGMGAVVTRDVPAGETWVGNPAAQLQRRKP
ncbi:acetyltransferase [Qipengyuania sp. JC766]|uniref:acetyltransferase n=1 Tax=Qipengyuania sp. JC766 TaxID=3232139 RepID=UPI003459C2E1